MGRLLAPEPNYQGFFHARRARRKSAARCREFVLGAVSPESLNARVRLAYQVAPLRRGPSPNPSPVLFANPMLEIENLTKRFGPIAAVDGVSFAVGKGEVLGFLALTAPASRRP